MNVRLTREDSICMLESTRLIQICSLPVKLLGGWLTGGAKCVKNLKSNE